MASGPIYILLMSLILAVAILHTPMCGDAIGLISAANVIIPQSRRCLGRDYSLWPGSAQCPSLT
jgi:hypothetical protein